MQALRRHRILVVDDNAEAADLLGELLTRAGHDVVVAYDGPQALEAVDSFVPDVAVLDIGLPRIDGWDLAGRLRRRFGDQLRLIAVTGYGQPSDRARSLEVGFEAHLVKPVEARTILAQIAPAAAIAIPTAS